MELMIVAFPMVALSFRIVPNLNELDNIQNEKQCWYNDLIPECKKTIEEWDISVIHIIGSPFNFINGLANQIQNNFSDIKVNTIVADNEEDEDND